MYNFSSLTINGYHNQAVQNTFVQQVGDTRHLVIFFPGVAYTNDMPLAYYTRAVLLAAGADALNVDTNYHRQPDFRLASSEEQSRWLVADTVAAFNAGMAQRRYEQITLVGKSLGTLAVGYLAAAGGRPAQARCIWLTPLLRQGQLREQIKQGGQRGMFVMGTADPLYDAEAWQEVVAAVGGQGLLIPGADHSLEFPGDALSSLQALEQLIRAVDRFLAAE